MNIQPKKRATDLQDSLFEQLPLYELEEFVLKCSTKVKYLFLGVEGNMVSLVS